MIRFGSLVDRALRDKRELIQVSINCLTGRLSSVSPMGGSVEACVYASLVCAELGSAAITGRPPAGSFTTTPLKFHCEKTLSWALTPLPPTYSCYCKKARGDICRRTARHYVEKTRVAARTLSPGCQLPPLASSAWLHEDRLSACPSGIFLS